MLVLARRENERMLQRIRDFAAEWFRRKKPAVCVLRWKKFEWELPRKWYWNEQRLEMPLGKDILECVWGRGKGGLIPLWVFVFREVDSRGRRVYVAEEDPYEDLFEREVVRQMSESLEERKEPEDVGAVEEGA